MAESLSAFFPSPHFPTSQPPSSLKVLIVGLQALGCELTRLLSAQPISTLSLHDPNPITEADIAAGCGFSPSDINVRTRAEGLLDLVRPTNQAATINLIPECIESEAVLSRYSLVVMTDASHDTLSLISDICRSIGVSLVASGLLGVCGYVFVDFGSDFTVVDPRGEEGWWHYIADISTSNPCIVTLMKDAQQLLEMRDGDFVRFHGVEGLSQMQPLRIKLVRENKFQIDVDARSLSEYKQGGIVTEAKVPQTIAFQPYSDSVKRPNFMLIDAKKRNGGRNSHLFRLSRDEFSNEFHRFPVAFSQSDAEKIAEIAVEINEKVTNFSDKSIDFDAIRRLSLYSGLSIPPISTFFASIVFTEVFKATGRCTPLTQWLYVDWLECVETIPQVREFHPISPNHYSLFGSELQKVVENLTVLVVGSGAIIDETIHFLHKLGISSAPGSHLVHIPAFSELSNIAIESQSYLCDKVVFPEKSQPFLCDSFWESVDLVINATENCHDGLKIEQKCVWFEKPSITLSATNYSGAMQVIIPHETEAYSDIWKSSGFGYVKPQRVIKCMEESIVRAESELDSTFASTPKMVISCLENPSLFFQNEDSKARVLTIVDFVERMQSVSTVEDCVPLARDYFQHLFYDTVETIKSRFINMEDEGRFLDDKLFHAYQGITFNPNNTDHMGFILAATQSYAILFGIPIPSHVVDIVSRSVAMKADFVGKKWPQVVSEQPTEDDFAGKLIPYLLSSASERSKIHPICASHLHPFYSDFIHYTSVVRASAFHFPPPDRQKTDIIISRRQPTHPALPKLLASTAVIELYKVAQRLPRPYFRNLTVNLAAPLLISIAPVSCPQTVSKEFDPIMLCPVRAVPEGFTVWDKLMTVESCSLAEFLDRVAARFHVTVFMISIDTVCLYNTYIRTLQYADRMPQLVHAIYESKEVGRSLEGRKSLEVCICCEAEGGALDTPSVKYVF